MNKFTFYQIKIEVFFLTLQKPRKPCLMFIRNAFLTVAEKLGHHSSTFPVSHKCLILSVLSLSLAESTYPVFNLKVGKVKAFNF